MENINGYKKIIISGYKDIIQDLSERINKLEQLLENGIKKIASDAIVLDNDTQTNLFDINSETHKCTIKNDALPYIKKINKEAVINTSNQDTSLMGNDEKINPALYEGGSGGDLPSGMNYSKVDGTFSLQYGESNPKTLTFNFGNIATDTNFFEANSLKINTTLYDAGLPDGLTFEDGIFTISNPDTSKTECGINVNGVFKANNITYEESSQEEGTSGCILLQNKDASILVIDGGNYEIKVDDTGLDKDNVKYALNHEDKTCVCMGYQGEDKESLTHYDGMQSKAYVSYNNERYEIIEYYENAFKDCKNLEIHHLPDTIKVLGKHCFNGCESSQLESLPEQLEEIRDYALAYNKQMTSLLFSSYVRKIDSHVVFGNLHLKNIDLTKCMYLQQISKFAFDGANGSRVLITKDQHKKWSSFINTNKKGLKTIASVEMITV